MAATSSTLICSPLEPTSSSEPQLVQPAAWPSATPQPLDQDSILESSSASSSSNYASASEVPVETSSSNSTEYDAKGDE